MSGPSKPRGDTPEARSARDSEARDARKEMTGSGPKPPIAESERPAPHVSGTGPRPFRVLGLQQIAIGGTSKAALRGLWVDLFGVPATGTFRSERENVDEDILALGGVEIDLMQPIDPDGKPRVHEPPLNHIGLWVDDLAAAVTWLTAQGMRFTPGGIRRGAAGHDVCFIHPRADASSPRSGEGVLIELVQAPADVIARLGEATGTTDPAE